MSFHQQWYEWSMWFWPLILNHLWQTTLFALFVGLAVFLLRNGQAQARYFLWWVVLAKFVLPSAVLAWMAEKIGVFWQSAPMETASGTQRLLRIIEPVAQFNSFEPLTGESHAEWFCLLTALWLLGAVALLLRWGWQRWKLVAMLRHENKATNGREFSSLKSVCAASQASYEVALIVSARVSEPGVMRIWRPIILLPQGLSDGLSDEELDAVMMHELTHVRRWDNLLSLMQLMIVSVFWFHPLLWWIDRRLLAEREFACDEEVIRCGNAPQIYAASLWKIVQFGNGWTLAGTSRATGSNLSRRIEKMLNTNTQNKTTPRQRVAIWITITVLLISASAITFFTRSNIQAQNLKRAVESTTSLPANNTDVISIIKPADFPRLKAEAKGKVLVVNFWATWCPPCLKEIPEFARLEKEYRSRGVHVVTISLDEKAQLENAVMPFLKKQNAEFQSFLFDSTNQQEIIAAVDKSWAGSLPATYVFDKAGNVVLSKHGKIQRAELLQNVQRALAGQINDVPNQDGILTAAEVTTRPVILSKKPAKYTREALDAGVSGVITLNAIFGIDRKLHGIRVLRGLSHGLNDEAIKAAQEIQFTPATKDGQPVNIQMSLEYTFSTYK